MQRAMVLGLSGLTWQSRAGCCATAPVKYAIEPTQRSSLAIVCATGSVLLGVLSEPAFSNPGAGSGLRVTSVQTVYPKEATMQIKRLELSERKERRALPVRRETIDQLIEQLFVVQKIGQWLAHETHGDAYVSVRELNELFHQANIQLRQIKNGTAHGHPRPASGPAVPALLR